MHTKYYISTALENNQFISKVFSSTTNQLVYTSKPYDSQEQALADARTFTITSAPPSTTPAAPKTFTTTTTYTTQRPIQPTPGRCCGR